MSEKELQVNPIVQDSVIHNTKVTFKYPPTPNLLTHAHESHCITTISQLKFLNPQLTHTLFSH